MEASLVRDSKLLSRVLRHAPHVIGVTLDAHGWADVDALLHAAAAHGYAISRERLDQIVTRNDKQRFAFDDAGRRIRAHQGHSIDVDLGLTPVEPPARLYHGTATRYLLAILRDGVRRGSRRHVHLCTDPETARRVGARHGTPAVLGIRARAMHATGHVFHRTANGVWLVDAVPSAFLQYPLATEGRPLALPSDHDDA